MVYDESSESEISERGLCDKDECDDLDDDGNWSKICEHVAKMKCDIIAVVSEIGHIPNVREQRFLKDLFMIFI